MSRSSSSPCTGVGCSRGQQGHSLAGRWGQRRLAVGLSRARMVILGQVGIPDSCLHSQTLEYPVFQHRAFCWDAEGREQDTACGAPVCWAGLAESSWERKIRDSNSGERPKQCENMSRPEGGRTCEHTCPDVARCTFPHT